MFSCKGGLGAQPPASRSTSSIWGPISTPKRLYPALPVMYCMVYCNGLQRPEKQLEHVHLYDLGPFPAGFQLRNSKTAVNTGNTGSKCFPDLAFAFFFSKNLPLPDVLLSICTLEMMRASEGAWLAAIKINCRSSAL